jgi:Na+/melibiose symporter-like transporter
VPSGDRAITRGLIKLLSSRAKRYFKENWGAPFIVGFILLLVIAAVCLSIGSSQSADGLASSAYSALVVGIVLQLVCFFKYTKEEIKTTSPTTHKVKNIGVRE